MNIQNKSQINNERFPLLPIITAIFVTVLVLTPSAASKFISFGPFVIVGATLFFPISYIFGDILTEVYGFERSRRIIWIGLGAQLFAALMYFIIQYLPAPSFWQNQEAYNTILGQAPRVVFASIIAYFIGEFVNSFIVSKMKFLSGGKSGKKLALRFVVSTVCSEFFDSFLFLFLAFYSVIANADLLRTALSIWFLKSMYEIILLPFTMKFVAWIKNREGIDIIDYPEDTKYTPFKL